MLYWKHQAIENEYNSRLFSLLLKYRYYGEYTDLEMNNIYLRNRYYDASVGRFISEDTHWNSTNMIYGDNRNNGNPSIAAIMQSSNLYVYCGNNPIRWIDPTGANWDAFDAHLMPGDRAEIQRLTDLYDDTNDQNKKQEYHLAAMAIRDKYLIYDYLNGARIDLEDAGINESNFREILGITDENVTFKQTKYELAMYYRNNNHLIKRDENGHLSWGTYARLGALAGFSKLSKAARATDVPKWAKGNKPNPGESGKDFSKRLMDEKYGEGNYNTGPGSEYNKIKKWGDRNFK